MNQHTPALLRAIPHTVCVCFLASLAACGGGDDSTAALQRTDTGTEVAQVLLEGCVDSAINTPIVGIRVHALAVDGRLIGSAVSNSDGVFTLAVPARKTVRIGIDAPASDTLEVLTGQSNLSVGGCLRDPGNQA